MVNRKIIWLSMRFWSAGLLALLGACQVGSINITAPESGQRVSGKIEVTVDAPSDVESVKFYVDKALLGEDTEAPFSHPWDTTAHEMGEVKLMVVAYIGDDIVGVDDDTAVEVANYFTSDAGEDKIDAGVGRDVYHMEPDTAHVDSDAAVEPDSAGFDASGTDTTGVDSWVASDDAAVGVDQHSAVPDAGAVRDSSTGDSGPVVQYDPLAFAEVSGFGENPGKLKMFIHVPEGMTSANKRPLVLALHGCDPYAVGHPAQVYHDESEWYVLADEYKFYVMYPGQQPEQSEQIDGETHITGNDYYCFDWGGYYVGGDATHHEPANARVNWERGKGENLSIINMINQMKQDYAIDEDRIYITGFSGGGAQAVLMTALWPDVFAASAPVAGITFHCNDHIDQVKPCLEMDNNPSRRKTAQEWGDLIRTAFDYNGDYPPMFFWQGSNDQFVMPGNLQELMKQWTNVMAIDDTADETGEIEGYTHKKYTDGSGKIKIETLEYEQSITASFNHALPIDPGSGEFQGGQSGSWAKDADIFSSYWIADFFGLLEEQTAFAVTITEPSNASPLDGTVTIAATAQDASGIDRLEFYIDAEATPRSTDTSAPYSYDWDTTADSDGAHQIRVVAFNGQGQQSQATLNVILRSGGSCNEVTDTNLNHVAAGRAEDVFSSAYAVGSGHFLGIVGTIYYSPEITVSETSPGYWELGSCP